MLIVHLDDLHWVFHYGAGMDEIRCRIYDDTGIDTTRMLLAGWHAGQWKYIKEGWFGRGEYDVVLRDRVGIDEWNRLQGLP